MFRFERLWTTVYKYIQIFVNIHDTASLPEHIIIYEPNSAVEIDSLGFYLSFYCSKEPHSTDLPTLPSSCSHSSSALAECPGIVHQHRGRTAEDSRSGIWTSSSFFQLHRPLQHLKAHRAARCVLTIITVHVFWVAKYILGCFYLWCYSGKNKETVK